MKTNDNGVDRDMTEEEIQAYEKLTAETKAASDAIAAEVAAKAAIRETVIKKLGLTADEVIALLS